MCITVNHSECDCENVLNEMKKHTLSSSPISMNMRCKRILLNDNFISQLSPPPHHHDGYISLVRFRSTLGIGMSASTRRETHKNRSQSKNARIFAFFDC